MLFNSHLFIFVFLPICLLGFYALYKQRNEHWIIWINLCSVIFYGYWSLNHLAIFLSSIVFNYLLCQSIKQKNKLALSAGIVFNLGLLIYFKYTNFLIDQLNATLHSQLEWINVVLPIGISFFTFQQIAYLVDLYQGKSNAIGFMRYFFFISFFPQLIAGPIVHHSEIFSQFNRYKNHMRNLAIGLSIFSVGLFKKVIIADTVALTANRIFSYAQGGGELMLFEAWYGALAYALQIYFDFSAYSEMAIGLARMFGFKLPQNFASPYKATSITDFWRRWHITLSRFLRDYLYIPLGGNRKGSTRRYVNLMTTMVIGGMWHGASWSFVLWGGLHGLFLVINQSIKTKLPKIIGWLITILCVVFAWVPFRSTNIEGTLNIWKGMLTLNGISHSQSFSSLIEQPVETGILLFALLALCVFAPNVTEIFSRYNPTLKTKGYPATFSQSQFIYWRPTLVWSLALVVLFILSILKLNEPSDFLYFQF